MFDVNGCEALRALTRREGMGKMEDEKTPEQRERAYCLQVAGDYENQSFDVMFEMVLRERQAVRAEADVVIDNLTEQLADQNAIKAQLDTAREQRDTYYAGMKEAKAQLERVTAERDAAGARAAHIAIEASRIAITRDSLAAQFSTLRTASEQAREMLVNAMTGTRALSAYRVLNDALDATKPASEVKP